MITVTSNLKNLTLTNQRVFLRVDLNVPIKNKKIVNDHRLRAIKPTIDLIQEKGGKIILATHIGRPHNHDPNLSTKILIPWFKQQDYKIEYESDFAIAYEKSFKTIDTILLLENMRFFPGEKKADQNFAQQLARLGDYYVNDAFALLHRNDTSITLVPKQFPPSKRTIGLLIEQELIMLNKLLNNPQKPFVLIIGGGKVSDKLPLLYNLLDKVNTILLCPAIVFTFLRALGKSVGKSLVDKSALELCQHLLHKAQKNNVNIMFPIDYQIAHDTFDGPLSIVEADTIPDNGIGISIGPKTATFFAHEIRSAKTIFFNGLMGTSQRKETLEGVNAIFKAMGQSPGLSIIGGGDSVAAAQLLGVEDKISYLSTGGGATLTHLSEQELPGLTPFTELT